MKISLVFLVFSTWCTLVSAGPKKAIFVTFEQDAIFSEMISLIQSFELVEVAPLENTHAATIAVPCDETSGWINIFKSIEGFASVIEDTVVVSPGGGQTTNIGCEPADEAIYDPNENTLVIPKTHDGVGNVFRVELGPPFNILSIEQL